MLGAYTYGLLRTKNTCVEQDVAWDIGLRRRMTFRHQNRTYLPQYLS
jgi:hypothetical protein